MKDNHRIINKWVQEQLDDLADRQATVPSATHFAIDCPDGTSAIINCTNTVTKSESIDNLPECCFHTRLSKRAVFEAITKEREYQDDKFGKYKEQSLPGFLVVLKNELDEAFLGWAKNSTGRSSALHEILQVAATAVACLEKYGVEGSAYSTDDIPEDR